MEKRTILAIALSFLILVGFDYVYKKYFLPPPTPPQAVEDSTPAKESTPSGSENPTVVMRPEAATQILDTDTVASDLQEIVIESDLYRAVISNRGAVLASWVLNNYKSTEGREFEMVPEESKGEPWSQPGSLFFENPDISGLANNELYEITVNGRSYSGFALAPPVDVVMTLQRGDLSIQKTYSFSDENYSFNLSAKILKGGAALEGRFLLGQDIGPIEDHLVGRKTELEATYFQNGKVERESVPDEEEGAVAVSGNIQWIGLDMHYFTAIAIPEKPLSFFEIRGFSIEATGLDGNDINRNLLSIKYPFDGSFGCLVYMGPKKQDRLKAFPGYDLSGVIDYGMFSVISLPLLYALRWIQQYVNNYGFSIVLLTFLLSILLLPLRLKQMASMKKMQVVQPKVKVIQEKYKKYKKTDPKRSEMNKEVMALYKENKVNPMGGCLPLLVQMPLLFAFYSLLANSIELRQAPFIFWIHDLAAKDPYYVLPVVMGITMFLSQKITPMAATADNSQAKMMQYLPIVFTFMFLTVSSGLNLYFLCSNIFQVGFQKLFDIIFNKGKNEIKSKRRK